VGAVAVRLLGGAGRRAHAVARAGRRTSGLWPSPAHYPRCRKTGKARAVPVHPHLVEMGLLDYVEAVKARLGKQGPLFFRPSARPSRNPNYRGPAVKARERLAGWVRELGVTDPGIQPNHAWRHTFKRRAARAGIEPRIRDGICGHTPRTVAEAYELPTVEDMAVALPKFPRWKVSDQG
jgi:integrase